MVRRVRKPAQDGEEGAKKTAISLLAYKENTKKELYEKLTERGYSAQEAAGAVVFVTEKNFLNEERFYKRFVENCANVRLLGKRRILQELRLKKFARETAEACAEETFAGIDFAENCYTALRKFGRGDLRKAAAMLMRRGYDTDEIRAACARYAREESEETDEEKY